MVQNAPPPLDFIEKMYFSYPINTEYPNTIAFSGIQSGVLMAYSSGSLIIVLYHSQYVNSILSGHKGTIISVAFEMKGPHIIACDIYGTYYFWHYNDTGYEKSRVVNLGIPATCISWFPARREVSLSTSKGLLYGSIHSFGSTELQKLNNRSTFCQFNSDGTLLASHHNSSVINFYIFSSNMMMTQAVRHLNPIILFDFHPYLPIFLSITSDLVLHIWRLTSTLDFVCTSRIKVNGLCKFIRYPIYFIERMKTDQKPARIAFVNKKNEISSIQVDRSGSIINDEKVHFDFSSNSHKSYLLAAFKTSFGVNASVIEENGITVISKNGQNRQVLYHTSNISQISFQEKSDWIFTLDELGSLIVWPVFDPYYSSNIVTHNASKAAWYNDHLLLYFHFEQLSLYNIYTSETLDFKFPTISNCKEIYVDNKETVYVLTESSIILKNSKYEIPEFSCHSFSKIYDDHFILVLSLKSTSKLSVFLFPEFKELKCAPYNQKTKIKSIAITSIGSFAVLNEETLDFWNYSNGIFTNELTVQLPKMKFIQYCSSFLFACDEHHLYSVSNGVHPLLSNDNISSITADISGNIACAHGKSFSVIPTPWTTLKTDISEKVTKNTIQEENGKILIDNVSIVLKKNANGNKKQKEKVPLYIEKFPFKPIFSPYEYASPTKETFNVIHSTLLHLLEYESLFDFIPRQIPAVPNQLAFHLPFPKPAQLTISNECYDFSFDGKDFLQVVADDKRDDFDLFGLRYLYAIHESAFPLSYFALWLSFSLHQSEITDFLVNSIDSNDLSKFFIPLAIHDHKMLVDIVKASVQRNWTQNQKVENVALLLIALGQQATVSKLYSVIGDMQRSEFFTHDFKTPRYRKSAIKNAYSSLCHGGYEMSAALFIISGEIKNGMNIIMEKIRDPGLGFLILRLLTNSDYEAEIMKWFFSAVKWNDDVTPILVAKLTNEKNLIELFEKVLIEKENSKNISTFGDRRIALFQIYYHIASKQKRGQNILYKVARNLCCDGLAPLAMYLYKLIECPYTVARSIVTDKVQQNDEKIEIEPEKENSLELIEIPAVKEVDTFNFGGVNDFGVDDDEWSDSESDSEGDSENKSKSNIEEKSEVDNSKILSEENESEVRSNPIENNEYDLIVEKSIRNQSFYLAKMLTDYNDENTKNDDDNEINNDVASFALKMGNVEIAAKFFDQSKIYQLEQRISRFIQFYSIKFLYSALVPIKPSKLYQLCVILLKLSTKRKKISFNYPLLKKHDRDGFSIFSFLGAFVVSLWTYHHNLLYRILVLEEPNCTSSTSSNNNNNSQEATNSIDEIAQNKDNINITNANTNANANTNTDENTNTSITNTNENANTITSTNTNTNTITSNDDNESVNVSVNAGSSIDNNDKNDIITDDIQQLVSAIQNESNGACKVPPPRSLFDIDLSSSRFPDTIPKLLQHYLSESNHGLEQSLERDRLLIMYLIFSLMLNKLSRLHDATEKNAETAPTATQEFLKDAYANLTKILEFRKETILSIIEFHQLSLNCPTLAPPRLLIEKKEMDPMQEFIGAIINEHTKSFKLFESIQRRILKKLPLSFVISMRMSTEIKMAKKIYRVRVPMIKGIVTTPLNTNKLIAISSTSIFSVDLESDFVSPEKSLPKSNNNDDPFQIVIHPHLNLILVMSPFNASFYDFNSIYGNKVSISFNQYHSSRFTCAQFSPNGEKVAICSTFIEIYFFDFTTEHQSPFIQINVYGQVNSILWLNQDTFLIAAYISNKDKSQKLAFINLLSLCITPLPIDPNLRINVMEIERKNGLLLLGTKNGKAAIIELASFNDFKLKWIYDFKKTEVSAVAALNGLFAFGTLEGDVLLVYLANDNSNLNSNAKMKFFKVQFAITSIIIETERIIIAGNANFFEVWKADEYI